MKLLAMIVFAMLAVIAAVHIYWGLGGLWPATDEQTLVKTVIGAPGWTQMPPPWMTFIVSGLIFSAGLFALRLGGVVTAAPLWFARLAGAVLTIVFAGRGASGYWIKANGPAQTEPFATLDALYFSPLCIAFGLAFAILTIAAPRNG
ncbi:MAG: DUF3995 domain-containing protein [Pseudomonadota bacterium]